jgi:peptidoglycan/xylan/chitin deacetylase (PgdA/CDA1 family)
MHRAAAESIRADGHEIGNHTYSHPDLSFASWNTIDEEIRRTDGLIASLGNETVPCFRAPFGVYAGLLPIYLWFHRRTHCLFSAQSTPPDYLRPNPREIATSLASRAEPGAILLLHDGEGNRSETVEALELLIRALRNRNFAFKTVSELLAQ